MVKMAHFILYKLYHNKIFLKDVTIESTISGAVLLAAG